MRTGRPKTLVALPPVVNTTRAGNARLVFTVEITAGEYGGVMRRQLSLPAISMHIASVEEDFGITLQRPERQRPALQKPEHQHAQTGRAA